MVATSQDLGVSRAFLFDDWVCPMSADIVEGINLALSVTGDDEIKTCDLVSQPVAGVLNAHAVGDEEPALGEDCSAFKFVHLRCCVP